MTAPHSAEASSAPPLVRLLATLVVLGVPATWTIGHSHPDEEAQLRLALPKGWRPVPTGPAVELSPAVREQLWQLLARRRMELRAALRDTALRARWPALPHSALVPAWRCALACYGLAYPPQVGAAPAGLAAVLAAEKAMLPLLAAVRADLATSLAALDRDARPAPTVTARKVCA